MTDIETKVYENFGKFITKTSKITGLPENECAKVIAIYIASNYNDVLEIID